VEQRTGRSFPRSSGAEERDDSPAEQQAPEQKRSEGSSSSQKYPQSLTYRQAREDEWYVALRDGREMLQSASWRRRSEEEEKDGLPRREADYMAAMEEDPFSLLITPNTYIPPVRPLIEVVDGEGNHQRVANGGDMVALTGIPGSGKTSAAVAAISGALNPDSKEIGWGWKVHNPEDGAVIVFDTEQPTYAVRDRMKEIEGLTGGRTPYIWAIRGVSAHQRLRALCMAIAAVAEKHEGRIHTIVIDGVTDLAPTVNDEVMAKELVEFLGIVADELGCALLGVVHQNKQGQDPSPRGHIGQEFQRKSASVLGVTQVKGDSTHSVKCLHSPVGKLRHGILPYDLGPKAKYCKEAGRFVELDGELAKQLEESKDSAWDRVAVVFSDNPNGRVTQTEASSVYHDKGLRKTPSSAKKAVSVDFGRMVNEGIMAKEEDKPKGAQYWLTPDGVARLREEKGEEDMGVESPW
jgi:KaiC/GvpD/RAD55 family RecA-like ATPase